MIAMLVGVLGTIATAGLLLQVIFVFGTWKVFKRRMIDSSHRPPVSVLRPICGLDDDFEDNLRSVMELSYPSFEVIVIAASADDAALQVVRRVQARYPSVPLKVVVTGPSPDKNPKVASLIAGAREARHDWLLVSDSNVRVHPDYLRRLANLAGSPEVGMVSNLVVGTGAETLGAQLENMQLNGYLLPATAAADSVAHVSCVMGKSMFFRRSTLGVVGGFSPFLSYLAEDYLLARAVSRAGQRVVISPDLLCTVNRTWSFRRFLSRHLRWNQIRYRLSPLAYVVEGLTMPSVPLLGLAIVGLVRSHDGLLMAALLMLLLRLLLQGLTELPIRSTVRAGLVWPLLVLLRDLFAWGIWLLAPLRPTVSWRGRSYRLGPDTRIEPLAARQRQKDVFRPEAAEA